MKINKDNLAWRTRGFNWDYDFVLRFSSNKIPNLYGLHSQIFNGSNPDNGLSNKAIKLQISESSFKYVIGTCFLNDDNCDEFNRPIRHYFIYFSESKDAICKFPHNWGKQLLQQLIPKNVDGPITKEIIASHFENLHHVYIEEGNTNLNEILSDPETISISSFSSGISTTDTTSLTFKKKVYSTFGIILLLALIFVVSKAAGFWG